MSPSTRFAASLVVLCLSGCNSASDKDQIAAVGPENERMNSAMAAARDSLDAFRGALNAPSPQAQNFTVKKGFPIGDDPEALEHMWISDVRADGQNFVGTLDNAPAGDVGVSLGDEVTITPDEVSDWMYFVISDNGPPRLVGGYTMYALHDILTGAELESFKATLPFDLSGEPVTQ